VAATFTGATEESQEAAWKEEPRRSGTVAINTTKSMLTYYLCSGATRASNIVSYHSISS
jgi:hypothetical protein